VLTAAGAVTVTVPRRAAMPTIHRRHAVTETEDPARACRAR